jgi:hypothetical protein
MLVECGAQYDSPKMARRSRTIRADPGPRENRHHPSNWPFPGLRARGQNHEKRCPQSNPRLRLQPSSRSEPMIENAEGKTAGTNPTWRDMRISKAGDAGLESETTLLAPENRAFGATQVCHPIEAKCPDQPSSAIRQHGTRGMTLVMRCAVHIRRASLLRATRACSAIASNRFQKPP